MVESTTNIWEQFSHRLRRIIIKRVGNYHDGEDILQDVFFKIYKNIHSLNDKTKLDVGVYQITHNTITDYYRRQKKQLSADFADITKNSMDIADAENSAGISLSCIKPMVHQLPEKYRQAIIMTEYEGLTQKEMANKVGLSVSGAKSRIQRARAMLKKMLLECCAFEFDRLGNILEYQYKNNACPFCNTDHIEQ